jgi:hypothetical protein
MVKAGRRLPPRSYLWKIMTQGHFCVMWYWTKVYKKNKIMNYKEENKFGLICV